MDTSYTPSANVGEAPVVDREEMDESELLSILDSEESQCLGQHTGDLSNQRAKAMDYYLGQPFGDEIEGRSQVVSSDVFDAVEAMLPSILEVFTASDKAVEFSPEGMEDREQAEQITDACNYVFYRQNPGFLILYTWAKDALISKNGIVKFYYEKKTTVKKESYRGLTDLQLVMLAQDPAVRIVGHSARPDPMPAPMGAMQPQPQIQQGMMGMPMPPMPPPVLHDVDIEVTDINGKVCVENVPPEEFLITARHTSLSLQECEFCEHRRQMTVSAVREMGYEIDEQESGSGYNQPFSTPEAIARAQVVNDTIFSESESTDASMRKVWVCEAYIRVDYDGDGIAELRRVLRVGRQILANEETDFIPFSAITPNIIAHQFYGLSLHDIIGDIQYQKSAIWRQMLDSLYLANMPRMKVLSSPSGAPKANLDDLLTARPGGLIREYEPNAVTPIETRFVGQQSFPMLEYMDSVKESRVGVTRYNQGMDADSLNKTAHGVMAIMGAANQRMRLVARIFAETGVKDLFRGIMHCLAKYSMKPVSMRLRNQFVAVDPRQWKTQWDMVVNVGLGTGDKQQQLQHLGAIMEIQKLFLAGGKGHMVTDENLYNTAAEMVENAGLKYVDAYFTNPHGKQPPPPPPNPEIIKIQAEQQRVAAQMQADKQQAVFEAQANQFLEQMKLQMKKFSDELNAQTQMQLAQMQIASEERIKEKEIRAQAEVEIFRAQSQGAIEGARLESDERKTDKQLEAKKTEKVEKEAAGGEVTREMVKRTDAVVDAVTKSTDALTKAVENLSKQKTKPTRRSGSFNGKPFEITEQ